MITPSDKSPESAPQLEGNGGLSTPRYPSRHFRRDCRDIVQILKLIREDGTSVYREQEIVAMLRGVIPLVAAAVQEQDRRGYRAVMQIPMECAKLEILDRPREVHHTHVEVDVDQLLAEFEAEAERSGLTLPPPDDGDGNKDGNGDGRQ